MKPRLVLSVCLSLAGIGVGVGLSPAVAQPSVGVSIGINQPGIYGRINIGNHSEPQLVHAQPIVIVPTPVAAQRQPIYLYVPPAHQHDWRRYCGRYSACGQPVYFVQEKWVRERYEREHPDWNKGRHRGWDKNAGDPHGHDRDHDQGKHKDKKDKKDKHRDRD